ncbi:RAI1-domain-containing protein [Gloeophyllum trabeum ATCC 11539]|uniref:Decapping nuclease n=1 Tax=Gloeophyllum trabeum (strain ATCC 11539 / FP-39264 / Madison 617) TaxID=670483 RepID=S7RED5_GLOTA|nr:RAI1-domain-containing protein [Gloeophyllum trabeum ATCC 11539]EPQ52575.1 RAI1-domain-containing protein [Gloeophyllum trabeum ATCC 11539]
MSKRSAPEEDGQPLTKRLRKDETSTPLESTLSYPSTSIPPKISPVPIQQPTSLLTFSYTPSRELVWDDSAMKYYVDPPPGAELSYGYERWVKKPEERGRIDSLLRAWSKARMPGIGLVSWRGVMTKILTAPYEERDSWDLNVMCVNGTLYLEEHSSDARLKEKDDMNPRQRMQTYYGYAFESWCTSSSPDRPESLPGHRAGWGGDVDTNVQWCNVIKTKLGDVRMVIGGEVDCIRGRKDGKHDAFVELKTSLAIRDQRDEARFEKKLLKFYFQSFLLGVPEIIVGFRTPSGRLTTIQTFKTVQLPRLVRGKPGAWDPQLCLDWGRRFLTFLKSTVQTDPNTPEENKRVWRVRFTPGKGVSVRLLDEEGVRDVEGGEERVGFLPNWFWEEEMGRKEGDKEEPRASEQGKRDEAEPPVKLDTTRTQLPLGWTI